jgi:hypothetical protein
MRIRGITGTNGKTTTTWILAEFLRADPSRRVAYVTTVEVDTTLRKLYTGYTTPPLAKLKELFAEMESAGCTDCVMEVSSHAIHQNRTGDTVFAGGAFTNLSEDHLDYHKTMEEYFRVKLSFAKAIATDHAKAKGWGENIPPQAGRGDFPVYVVCMDGGYGEEMLAECGKLPLNVLPVSNRNPFYDLSRLQLVGEYNRSIDKELNLVALLQEPGKDTPRFPPYPRYKSSWEYLMCLLGITMDFETITLSPFKTVPVGITKLDVAGTTLTVTVEPNWTRCLVDGVEAEPTVRRGVAATVEFVK